MANNFEKSMVAVNAYVLFFNHQERNWSNHSGICNIQIFENQCNNSFRVVGWQLQTKQVVLNCAITKSFRYNQTTSSFHQWNDSVQSVGLNFQDITDAEKFSSVILAAMEVTNALPILPKSQPVELGVYEQVEVTYPSLIYKQPQPVVSQIEQLDVAPRSMNQLKHQNSLPHFSIKQPVPIRNSSTDLPSMCQLPQPISPPVNTPPADLSQQAQSPSPSMSNIPPPPPPPPPPGPNGAGSSNGSSGGDTGFAQQLRSTNLRKTSSPVTKINGEAGEDKSVGRIHRSMSVAKGTDMLSEMQKVLAKRKSKQDSIGESGDNDKETGSASKTNGNRELSDDGDKLENGSDELQSKPVRSILEKFQSPEGLKSKGRSNSLAPKSELQGSMTLGRNKGSKLFESAKSATDDTLIGAKKNLLNNVSTSSRIPSKLSDCHKEESIELPESLQNFKKEILREVSKEINAAKKEILDAIRLELNKR